MKMKLRLRPEERSCKEVAEVRGCVQRPGKPRLVLHAIRTNEPLKALEDLTEEVLLRHDLPTSPGRLCSRPASRPLCRTPRGQSRPGPGRRLPGNRSQKQCPL